MVNPMKVGPKRRPRGPQVATPVEEKREMSAEERRDMLDRVTALAVLRRNANVSHREASGIESIWAEDEDSYEGVDDANRAEAISQGLLSGGSKPETGGVEPAKLTGCTLLPNITAPYVDAASAHVGDMLMPTDDRNFIVQETPEPDVADDGEGFAPVKPPMAPQGAMPGAQPGATGAQPGAMPQGAADLAKALGPMMAAMQGGKSAPGQPKPPEISAMEAAIKPMADIIARAKKGAKRAQTLIDDYLTECQYQSEVRQAIDDAAKAGTGVMKGPYPVKKVSRVYTRDKMTGAMVITEKYETVPASKNIDYWNAFPAAGCGDDIQAGDSFFEREFFTRKQLAALKGGVGPAAYLDDEIDAVLKEGPQARKAKAVGGRQSEELDDKVVFEGWYGYMDLTGADMEALGCRCEDETQTYHAIITMVNDRIIKAARNPLDSGAFPYDFLPWKRRKNMPWGIGVARQARVPQRTYTAAYRLQMDNAGASAKPHKISAGVLTQVDGDPWSWVFDPDDVGSSDARAAMQFIVQPSLRAETSAQMAQAQQMMETCTGLPMTVLGMQGNVEETAQGRTLLNNNGSAVLRRVARLFDSRLTEPHIGRYYEWLRQYNAVDDPEIAEGDFRITARGSAALVERSIQNQQIPAILNAALQPAYELDPRLAAQEWLKSQRFDPAAFKLTAERKQEMQASMPQPQPPYQVAVAQQREQGETQRMQMRLQHEAKQGDLDRNLEMALKNIDVQLASAELTADERQRLDDIKATLAGITIKVQAQKEISAGRTPGEVLKPPTEPAGRAPAGMSFQR